VAATVQGFLEALLAGGGDPGRYLAPGVVMTAAEPAPFDTVEVREMAVEEMENDEIRIVAKVLATTPGGIQRIVSYELAAKPRADRWEILLLWGAPTITGVPVPEESGSEPSPPTPTSSTTSADGEKGESTTTTPTTSSETTVPQPGA
jgi:hypothetical protein